MSDLRDKIKRIGQPDSDSDDEEPKESSSESPNHIYLYFHKGEEIMFDESSTIFEVFAGDAIRDEITEIEVDYRGLEAGSVDISSQGGVVQILDDEGRLVDVQQNQQKLNLARKFAFTEQAPRFWRSNPNKLNVVVEATPQPEPGRLEVREYFLPQEGAVIIRRNGNDLEVWVDGIEEPLQKGLAMIWLFKESEPPQEPRRYVLSQEPVLPLHTDLNRFFGQTGNVIDRNTITKALEVSQETYTDINTPDEDWKTPRRDFSDYFQQNVIFGNDASNSTRCILRYYKAEKMLLIGFRGTNMDSKDDWRTNLSFRLVETDGPPGKVHQGFNERSRVIMVELIEKIKDFSNEAKPKMIVVCGHSLGAAISQLVYMKLRFDQQNLGFTCQLVNITFATPMIGNRNLREEFTMRGIDQNMYHMVLAGDVIPAALFTDHLYHKLPQVLINKILRNQVRTHLQGEHQEHRERVERDIIPEVRRLTSPKFPQPVFVDGQDVYAPSAGHYLYIR